MKRRWLLAGALLLATAGAASGPGPLPASGAGAGEALDTIRVPDNPLEEAALRFARAWAAGSADAIAGVLVERGVRLQLGGPSHAGLSARQAAAAVREYLRDYEEVDAALLRASRVSGSPDRGSAVIQWTGRVSGTSQRVGRTLFLGLVREGGERWRVDEIRLVR